MLIMEQYSLHQRIVSHLHLDFKAVWVICPYFWLHCSPKSECKNRPKGDRMGSIELGCMLPQDTLNLFFQCFSFVFTLSNSSVSSLNFVLSSDSSQELWLVSVHAFIASRRGLVDHYPCLWGKSGMHGVEMEWECRGTAEDWCSSRK